MSDKKSWPTEYEYIDIPPQTKIRIGPSPIQGYGVFANTNIATDEVIETTTFLKTKYRTKHLIYQEMRQTLWPYPCSCDTCKHAGQNYLICNGAIQIYNSTNESGPESAVIKWYPTNRIVKVVALKPIVKDEEILVYYGSTFNYSLNGGH